MRRIAAVALSGATLMGGLALTTPANASTTSADSGKHAVVVRQATVAKATTKCRSYQLTRGRRTTGKHWHWLFYVRTKLTWCYDGKYVDSAKASYTAYTRNKKVYKLGGWSWHSLSHTKTYSSVTSKAKYRFVYRGHTYRPWVIVTGYNTGAYHYSYGG